MKKGLVCGIIFTAMLGGCVVVPAGPGYQRGYERGYRGW